MCSEQLKSSDCNNDDSCDVIPIHGTSVVDAEYLVPIYVNSNITTSRLRDTGFNGKVIVDKNLISPHLIKENKHEVYYGAFDGNKQTVCL